MRTLLLLFAVGCGAYAPARAPVPPALTRNPELEALETAVRWPEPKVNVVMLLATQYLATHREEEGHGYFAERARAVPGRPLFAALEGLFQIRMAWRIPLLKRVAWVEDGCRKLDGAATDPLSRYLRGLVYSELPPRFGRSAQAVADLQWMLDHAAQFPPGLRRGAEAGLRRLRGGERGGALLSDFSVSRQNGFRFSPRSLVEPAPGVYVARGYDFADLAWVAVDGGLVAIDAGTTEDNVRAALAALRQKTTLPVKWVILTHAHWDHVGGLQALAGAQVIAQSGYAAELARVNSRQAPFQYFFGAGAKGPYRVTPDRLVSQTESITIGGRRFVLQPVHGGETDDALLVQLPDDGIVFVGDAFMPYFGAPFLNEGSIDGFFRMVAEVEKLAPRQLIHGHAPLTDNFTIATVGPLSEALKVVAADTERQITDGKTLPEILARAPLPDLLAQHGDAVTPFLLMRDNLIKRLYGQSTGYWKSDGEGMEVLTPTEWGAALELAAGRDGLVRAAESLNQRGDFAAALQLARLALTQHPGDRQLEVARRTALEGLRARNQFNPFKLIIYSEMLDR
jgi:glyoxylase-like metal-dependent hydrolase (beta-lactamase superfamily II)